MLILGIESSCDDTAASVLNDDTVLSNILSSQDEIHSKFGGVVPELASRQHLRNIHLVTAKALEAAGKKLNDIELIAVTQGPGLIGSLLVGFSYAKGLAHVGNIPIVGVDHMSGHILSPFLTDNKPEFPYISLIVSGGTSALYLAESYTRFTCLGRTRDDAAGEAFDKVAKLLGLPYPGGPHVSALAAQGDPAIHKFPRSWLDPDSFDFSFSGLKTSVLNYVNSNKKNDTFSIEDVCAAFEDAVVDVLVAKTLKAAQKYNLTNVTIGGGVSANRRLREVFQQRCRQNSLTFFAPELSFCTDNGAMIAFSGKHQFKEKGTLSVNDDVYSRSRLG